MEQSSWWPDAAWLAADQSRHVLLSGRMHPFCQHIGESIGIS